MAEQFSAQIIPFPTRVPRSVLRPDDVSDLQRALDAQHLAVQKWNHALADLNTTMAVLNQETGTVAL